MGWAASAGEIRILEAEDPISFSIPHLGRDQGILSDSKKARWWKTWAVATETDCTLRAGDIGAWNNALQSGIPQSCRTYNNEKKDQKRGKGNSM